MRNNFAGELTDIAGQNKNVVLLSGDIGNKLFDDFKAAAPGRFFNCGIAEANMTGVAAGMAMMGFRPVTYSITPFVTVRCLEQIRIDVCYQNLPVVIVGTGSGLSYGELGPTHHSCDDIGFLRMLPGMSVVCPCDPLEVRLSLRAALAHDGPVYIRLGKKGEPQIHRETPEFRIGRSINVRAGNDICLLSAGNAMQLSLSVADSLQEKGISARVESCHTVKPIDVALLSEVFGRYKVVATIEEHSIIGGLGSVVAEWKADNGANGKLLRFGTGDYFLNVPGKQKYARECYGLTTGKILEKILSEFR